MIFVGFDAEVPKSVPAIPVIKDNALFEGTYLVSGFFPGISLISLLWGFE